MAKRKNQDEDSNENFDNSNESDDNFGLPEIEYEPINRDQASAEETSNEDYMQDDAGTSDTYNYDEDQPIANDDDGSYGYNYGDEEPAPVWPKVLVGVLVVLVLAGAGIWYFRYYKPKQDEAERVAALDKARKEEAEKKERARLDSIQNAQMERDKRIADSLANVSQPKAEGTIETLQGRTGLYHVVVASAIDDDLLMDHAKKLSREGVSTKIIPPYGKVKFYRLTIADGETYAAAQSLADGMKGQYGEALWVLKY